MTIDKNKFDEIMKYCTKILTHCKNVIAYDNDLYIDLYNYIEIVLNDYKICENQIVIDYYNFSKMMMCVYYLYHEIYTCECDYDIDLNESNFNIIIYSCKKIQKITKTL